MSDNLIKTLIDISRAPQLIAADPLLAILHPALESDVHPVSTDRPEHLVVALRDAEYCAGVESIRLHTTREFADREQRGRTRAAHSRQ